MNNLFSKIMKTNPVVENMKTNPISENSTPLELLISKLVMRSEKFHFHDGHFDFFMAVFNHNFDDSFQLMSLTVIDLIFSLLFDSF